LIDKKQQLKQQLEMGTIEIGTIENRNYLKKIFLERLETRNEKGVTNEV